MLDFPDCVEESADRLQELNLVLSVVDPSVPLACIEGWKRFTPYEQELRYTLPLFTARRTAWEDLQNLARETTGISNEDFTVQRFLKLSAYQTCTWAIYDRISNVCGRIGGTDEMSKNPKHNPKVCEDIIDGKQKSSLGFMGRTVVSSSYGWPVKVSYKIRNWLVHEGVMFDGINLFSGDTVQSQFEISEGAIRLLEQSCKIGDQTDFPGVSCISADEDPWSTKDVLKILESYNAENDQLFAALVQWCTQSTFNQVGNFLERFRD